MPSWTLWGLKANLNSGALCGQWSFATVRRLHDAQFKHRDALIEPALVSLNPGVACIGMQCFDAEDHAGQKQKQRGRVTDANPTSQHVNQPRKCPKQQCD